MISLDDIRAAAELPRRNVIGRLKEFEHVFPNEAEAL